MKIKLFSPVLSASIGTGGLRVKGEHLNKVKTVIFFCTQKELCIILTHGPLLFGKIQQDDV